MNNTGMDIEGYMEAKQQVLHRVGIQTFDRLPIKKQEEEIALTYLAKLLVNVYLERKSETHSRSI